MFMADQVTRIKVFVASPGDVQRERAQMEVVVNNLNLAFEPHKRVLELVRWETHVHPDAGRPQDVVNRQIPEYDIFIGVMWKRFGTPSDKWASGTEEEFRRATEAYKTGKCRHVAFYFSEAPAAFQSFTDEEFEQINKVRSFRAEVERENLVAKYASSEVFGDVVQKHLTRILNNWSPDTPPVNPVVHPTRFTVFVADVNEGLATLQRSIIERLDEAHIEVLRPPARTGQSQDLERLQRTIAEAHVSVHLLNDRTDPGVQQQLETAFDHAQRQCIWTPSGMSVSSNPVLTSRIGDAERRQEKTPKWTLLRVERRDARQAVLEHIVKERERWERAGARKVLINVNKKDANPAEDLISHLTAGGEIEAITDGMDDQPDLAEFEAKLLKSKGVIFVFGKADLEWVRRRIIKATQIVAAKDYSIKTWCVYLAPPPPKDAEEAMFKLPARPPGPLVWIDNTHGRALKDESESLKQLRADLVSASSPA
jgi:hypothetical protein